MVVTNDRSTQMAGIRMLAQAAEDGAMNPDAEAYIEIAGHALRQGATEVSFTPGTVPNVYHPVIRVEAARALAAGSTQSARDLLVEAVRNDPEALVRAEAMLALAAQPRGNVNATLVEIADALRAEAAVGRDRYMLVSGLQAVEDLVPHADLKELDPMVRQTLVEIAASGLNRIVRETAVSALTSM
jgi:hypothetical protein